jgi:uroporphyrinogen-III decarboxylase
MTSRQRMLAVAKGLPADRVPVMYWLNAHTTCRLLAQYRPGQSRVASFLARRLWQRFLRDGEFQAGAWTRAVPLLFEEYGNGTYALELGADVCILSPELLSPRSFITSLRKKDGHLSVRGPFGGRLTLGGIYMDPVEPAVRSVEELEDFQLPALAESQFAAIRKFRQAHPAACLLVEVTALQQAVCDYILGTTQFMLALYDDPDRVKAFLHRVAGWVEEIIRYAVPAGADLVFLQDDYGTTGRPLISPRMWQELTYPHLKRLVEVTHESGVPFMLHSCGYQMPFLDHYVEAGVDILQSFQPKAGNDLKAAYERYGDRLTFATGIDTQQGERMSPQELRQDILQSYRTGRRKGRHILSMTHMMQYTMPMDNVRALFDVVREIQAGEHD